MYFHVLPCYHIFGGQLLRDTLSICLSLFLVGSCHSRMNLHGSLLSMHPVPLSMESSVPISFPRVYRVPFYGRYLLLHAG